MAPSLALSMGQGLTSSLLPSAAATLLEYAKLQLCVGAETTRSDSVWKPRMLPAAKVETTGKHQADVILHARAAFRLLTVRLVMPLQARRSRRASSSSRSSRLHLKRRVRP